MVENCLIRKLPECFKVNSKLQRNIEIIENRQLSSIRKEDWRIWVKAQLRRSSFDCNAKHLILLTAKHAVLQVPLQRGHRDNLHEGTEYMKNILQHVYWIFELRIALCNIKSRYVKLRRRNTNTIHPSRADLPWERLDCHVFSFNNTAVDYSGLTQVTFLRRTSKWWCCLFTCLTPRAVHIEFARSLDSESCTIFNDNGTNLVRVAKELDEWDELPRHSWMNGTKLRLNVM